jgi:hypothetical protein
MQTGRKVAIYSFAVLIGPAMIVWCGRPDAIAMGRDDISPRVFSGSSIK